MTMNDGVMMISRHRQWRAWQFGRRRSGLFRNGGGSTGGGNDDTPNWVYALMVGYVVVLLLMMWIWPAAASYMLAGLFLAGIAGWVVSLFC
jgi:hypothetical protein